MRKDPCWEFGKGLGFRRLLIEILYLFKVLRAVLLPPSCRFTPTCSDYAAEALSRHRLVRALGLTSARLLRCHPWHPGGLDPVP